MCRLSLLYSDIVMDLLHHLDKGHGPRVGDTVVRLARQRGVDKVKEPEISTFNVSREEVRLVNPHMHDRFC